MDQQVDTSSSLVPFQSLDSSSIAAPEMDLDSQSGRAIDKNTSIEKPVVMVSQVAPASVSNPIEKPDVITPLKDQWIAPAESLEISNVKSELIFLPEAPELHLPNPHPRERSTTAWEIPLVFICLFLFLLVKSFNKRRFALMSNSFLNIRVVPQYLREENAFSNQLITVLTFNFILLLAMVILQSIRIFSPDVIVKPFALYSRLCLFIVLVYIAKFAILELLAEIFDNLVIVREYIYNVLLFNGLMGVVLLPLVLINSLMMSYHSTLITLGIAAVVLIYLMRNWRAVALGQSHKYPSYYIFLYLCTLEILPGLVMVKLLKEQLI